EETSAARTLADLVSGAARLGARRLIVVRLDESRSLYEPWLSLPGALPLPDGAPALLALSVGPGLGADLLGRRRFARQAAAPLNAVEPGYRPFLLEARVAATAPLRVTSRSMTNIVGYIEGSDPALKSEAVLLVAPYDGVAATQDAGVL